jgi:uncharacterized YccA/Bax inhibitor family protein
LDWETFVKQEDIIFVEIMTALGVMGVVGFLILLVSRIIPGQSKSGKSSAVVSGTQWYGYFLAAIVLAIAALAFLWRFPPSYMAQVAETNWQLDSKSMTFFTIMILISVLGLLVFIVYVISQQINQKNITGKKSSASADPGKAISAPDSPVANHQNPSATSLFGLLALALAYAILNWSFVSHSEQLAMMLQLIYPAGLVIALVMLFDKASRSWNIKPPGESLREWLFCGAITYLYILSYLNLLRYGNGENYGAMVVDLLNVLVYLAVFWMLDRRTTRLRFLITYGYLILLPIALLIWRTVQAIEIPVELSWWETIWPFFSLAVLFFVLEIIVLIIDRETRSQGLATAKDLLFLVLYVISLIIAIPESAAV